MYEVLIPQPIRKRIVKLQDNDYQRVYRAIYKLKKDPRPAQTKKLINSTRNLYRIRTGDWRVLYEINDTKKEVHIINFGLRKDIYK